MSAAPSSLHAAPPAAAGHLPTSSAPRDAGAATAVRLRGYGRRFGDRTVLRDVDLDVAPGELVAVLGPSGCGKSTMLRAVGGLDRDGDGEVRLDGEPVRAFDGRCAVGFQEPRLLPWRTLAGNVALGLPRGTAGGSAQQPGGAPGRRGCGGERVAELLRLVGLADFAGHRPRSVSGGMAQRASLARALARQPGVLLLDEPFGALDALTRLRMQDLLLDVLAVRPTTVLLVTHDVEEALHLADRVVVLGERAGASGATGTAGSTTTSIVTVPGARPRDRGDAELAALRAELLEQLGVHR